MANGKDTEALIERIDRIEQRWDKDKEARNAESAEFREAVATLDARQGETDRTAERIAGQLQALLDRKPPGALALWGPTVSTAVALAALFIFVIEQNSKPIVGDIVRVDEKVEEVKANQRLVIDRQWSMYGSQQYSKGRFDALEERVKEGKGEAR